MQAVVMAGGAGTRLRPLTTATPKALLPIVGEPMLARVVHLLADHGVDRVVVTLQHQASIVLKYFSSDRPLEVDLRFLTEPRPLGTAGVMSAARLPVADPVGFAASATFAMNGWIAPPWARSGRGRARCQRTW